MSQDKAVQWLYLWHVVCPTMPEPVHEYKFDEHLGRRHRFDFAWPEKKIAVEVDGGSFAFRGGRHATDTDRDKLNIAASLGWRVFRFSPQQLKADPFGCINIVAKTLEATE